MTLVDSQTVQCQLGGCLIAVITDASENIRPRLHIADVIGHIPVDKLDYRHLT